MLLFKLLETATNPIIRSNIVIALGDIAVCFSTLMDQNSDRLYAGLTDRDLTVKKNTLMVLTHLILNGMIKVKGQLGEMAKCIEDDDKRISDLARLFFEELSTKENAIYNNLPDIISHLSVGKHAVEEDTYQSIMKYIFRYIEKVRNCFPHVHVLGKLTKANLIYRKSKRSLLWKSCVSGSEWSQTSDNGVTLPSACPCCHSSQNVP